ncbi:MAG TPA: T9SS type A sorting domain-containing protein [Bacteroidia bacterium]|nr:T9SS type A sorting domain-containing protein [Bacteroidia bacterium]
MKKTCAILLFVIASSSVKAQITIDQNDMPSPGDTIRVSYGLVTAAIDPVPTGSNYTWDFSQLQWIAQNIDTFLTIAQTAPTYQLVFADVAFNPNRANVATRGNFTFPPIAGIQVSDVFDFFYKSSSQYRRVGYGANINGFDTPLPMNNFDILYNFPLNYNDNDSCDADFSLTLPATLYYGYTLHRVNLADGWGTLITPYGTFDVLRIKSTIAAHDSINFLATGTGFGFDRLLTTEYKWIGNNKSIPLLQINTTDLFGVETVTSIVYQDSIRVLPTGAVENRVQSEFFNVYPNPAKGNFTISMSLKNKAEINIAVYNSAGERVKELLNEISDGGKVLKVFNNYTLGLSQGIYMVHAVIDGKDYYQKLSIVK